MHAYLFATHEGEVPEHLIDDDPDGHHVFALAPLDGEEHSLFAGMRLADDQEFSTESTPLSATTTSTDWLIPCTKPDCLDLLPRTPINPCHLPPWEHLVFCLVDAEHLRDALGPLIDDLGPEGVAVATDGAGRFLVELGSDDREQLERAVQHLSDHPDVNLRSPHWSRGELLRRR